MCIYITLFVFMCALYRDSTGSAPGHWFIRERDRDSNRDVLMIAVTVFLKEKITLPIVLRHEKNSSILK